MALTLRLQTSSSIIGEILFMSHILSCLKLTESLVFISYYDGLQAVILCIYSRMSRVVILSVVNDDCLLCLLCSVYCTYTNDLSSKSLSLAVDCFCRRLCRMRHQRPTVALTRASIKSLIVCRQYKRLKYKTCWSTKLDSTTSDKWTSRDCCLHHSV